MTNPKSKFKTEAEKVKYIRDFAKKTNSETEVRKEIGRVWNVKKTARNEKFRNLFTNAVYPLGKQNESAKAACFNQKGNVGIAEVKGVEGIRTLEDLIEYAGIDTEVWESTNFKVSVWDGKTSVRADFKKKVSEDTQEIIKNLKEDLENYSPQGYKQKHKYQNSKGLLLEIAAFDVHLGKLGWKESDGGDTDINITKEVFMCAIMEIVEKAKNFGEISKIVFPIGNDFLTCDNSNSTTFSSTPQSVDSRFPKIFREGRKLLVWAIDYMKTVAPVDVVYVVSNHDTDSMFHMADAIQCWFRNDPDVNVEASSSPRKYYKYENNLIVYDHGDKIAPQKLAVVASLECKDWSSVNHRELHIGHIHHEKTLVIDNQDLNSCILRVIPALSGSDYYHNSNGYVGAKQRAQGFLWHPQNGLETILYSKSNN